ncbi:conjugal transfer protein TraX [Lactococcus lactis]|uniref:conjugal transfer protein TraX n=1 Tax=Lactococcus lactis TaxID=1358 RepID=UPI00223B5532|nr:conjugal transfer protein TraX [Lactococcus lactis]
MEQRFGLSGYQLKIIAIIFMLLDHIYLEVLIKLPGIPDFSILDMASRFVSPLFFFLMIEGFFYTRSRKKYLTRLLVAGAVMALGNLVIHYLMNVSISFFTILNPNIFLSLACGFAAVWLLNTIIEKKKILLIFPLILVSALSIFTEASLVALILPYLMYASRKSGKIGFFILVHYFYQSFFFYRLFLLTLEFRSGKVFLLTQNS